MLLSGRLTRRLSRPGSRARSLPPASRVALGVLSAVLLGAVLAPLITQDPLATGTPMRPPGGEHWFGTDRAGRDVFARVVHGARYSLVIGLGATGLALLAGAFLGSLAATSRRLGDESVMRTLDIVMSFPPIALAAVLVAVFGSSIPVIILTIAFVYTPSLARVVRANVMAQYGEDYVAAEKVIGAGRGHIVLRHVAVNCAAPVLVFATVMVAEAIIFEAGLSFIGAGVQDPDPSWGSVLAYGRQILLAGGWWATFFPGLALLVTVLALNVLSEGMTDASAAPDRVVPGAAGGLAAANAGPAAAAPANGPGTRSVTGRGTDPAPGSGGDTGRVPGTGRDPGPVPGTGRESGKARGLAPGSGVPSAAVAADAAGPGGAGGVEAVETADAEAAAAAEAVAAGEAAVASGVDASLAVLAERIRATGPPVVPVAADAPELLSVRDLAIRFPDRYGGVRVVDGISLTVHEGETLGLVGESGCGKSVTGLAVMGLLARNARVSGRILYRGRDLLTLAPRQRRALMGPEIAMVYQDALSSLNPSVPVGAQLRQLTSRGGTAGPSDLLDLVGLQPGHTLRSYPHELSGGQRQRVLIAMALSRSPRLLIADEPTTALDVTVQAQIVELLLTLRDRLGFAMVLVSHDLALVGGLAHRIAVMYAGQVAETGTTRSLLTAPAHHYTRGLLGSVVSLEAGARRLHQIPGVVPAPGDLGPGCRFASRCAAATGLCRTTAPTLAGFHDGTVNGTTNTDAGGGGVATVNGTAGGAGAGSDHGVACHHPVTAAAPLERSPR